MGWLIGLSIVAVLLLMPLGIGASYDADGGAVWFMVGTLKFSLYPGKKKDKKGSKQKQKEERPSDDGGSYSDFLPMLENALRLFSDLRRKLVITKLRCRLTLAGGDPCDLAVNYGRAWAAMGALVPLLDRVFIIKRRDLSVDCDFTDDTTRILFCIQGRISVIRLLTIVLVHGGSFIKKYYTIMNKRKGGANT